MPSLHDPLFSCDLKSAAFDRAWLLPQRYPVHRYSSVRQANDKDTLEFFGDVKRVVGRAGFEPATFDSDEELTQSDSRCKRDIIAGLD
jgi:hypothetical protein